MITSDTKEQSLDGFNRQGRGRPRDQEKNVAIIEAASQLFLEKGFDGTSMDEVARRAGVSKQTVYSHFSSKKQLFSDSVHLKIVQYFPEQVLESAGEHSLEADLNAVCLNFARLLVSDEAMQMYRILVAAAPKGPELATIFWDAGPKHMLEKLTAYLESLVKAGELDIPDVVVAAHHLISLLKGELHFRLAIGLIDKVDDEDLRLHAEECVHGFLLVYKKSE